MKASSWRGVGRGVESRRSSQSCEMPFCSKLIIKLMNHKKLVISAICILSLVFVSDAGGVRAGPIYLRWLALFPGDFWLALVFIVQINTTAGIGYLAIDVRDFMRTDGIVICLLMYSVLGLLIDSIDSEQLLVSKERAAVFPEP